MTALLLHRATLLGDDAARLHVLVVPEPADDRPERPRDTLETLLGALGVEEAERVPPFFLPSVVASLVTPAASDASREQIAASWLSPATLVEPQVSTEVRRFVESAMDAEIAPLGQSLSAAAAVASTTDAALFAGFVADSVRPVAALALPGSTIVCVSGSGAAATDAEMLQQRLEAWLRARAG